MDDFENERLLRLKDIIPGIIPISKSQWWAGIQSGIYPAGVKLGPAITAWRKSDIMHLAQNGVDQKKLSPAAATAGDKNARR